MKENKRGGARKGAGRKTIRAEKMTKTAAFRVYPELVEKLEIIKQQQSLSKFFNEAIKRYKIIR